jgi:uncharacterized membrane protein YjgN (DUF898 family)
MSEDAKTTNRTGNRSSLIADLVLDVRVSVRAFHLSKWGFRLSSIDQNLDFHDTLPGGPVTIPNPVANTADGVTPPSGAAPPPANQREAASAPTDDRLIRFTGDGTEYFKIWAVNLALTIVTLGIFSAWAKVRRLRYFYANTTLTGSTFDFHGAPAAILRGRIIALVVLIGYTQAPKISLALYGVVALFILAVFPWLYWRSLRFRLGNTSFRGARFNFTGDLRTAYQILLPPAALFLSINVIVAIAAPSATDRASGVMLVAKLGAVYLLGLAIWPYYYYRLRAYQHGNTVFGVTPFAYLGTVGQFYVLAGKILIIAAVAAMVMGLDLGILVASSKEFVVGAIVFGLLALIIYISFFAVFPYASARAQNIVWDSTELGGARFTSTLSFASLLKVEAVNLLATMLTCGLFRPFAAIRTAKLRIEAVAYQGDPASFQVGSFATGGPAGAEIGEMIGFDIAL